MSNWAIYYQWVLKLIPSEINNSSPLSGTSSICSHLLGAVQAEVFQRLASMIASEFHFTTHFMMILKIFNREIIWVLRPSSGEIETTECHPYGQTGCPCKDD